MAQIHADPEELRRFARDLSTFNLELSDMSSRIMASFSGLADTWRDQEHEKFASDFTQTMRVIESFIRMADEHVPLYSRDLAPPPDYWPSATPGGRAHRPTSAQSPSHEPCTRKAAPNPRALASGRAGAMRAALLASTRTASLMYAKAARCISFSTACPAPGTTSPWIHPNARPWVRPTGDCWRR